MLTPDEFKAAVRAKISQLMSTDSIYREEDADVPTQVSSELTSLIEMHFRQTNTGSAVWYQAGLPKKREELYEYGLLELAREYRKGRQRWLVATEDSRAAETSRRASEKRAAAAKIEERERNREMRERARELKSIQLAERHRRELAETLLNRPAPMPQPLPYGVSHEGAELLAMDWMRFLGVLDAEVTRFSADGGIDVTSDSVVAQVKNYAGSVPVEDIRGLFGVATAMSKAPWFFTSGVYTVEAAKFAELVEMPLFHFSAVRGLLEPINEPGFRAVAAVFPKDADTPRSIGSHLLED